MVNFAIHMNAYWANHTGLLISHFAVLAVLLVLWRVVANRTPATSKSALRSIPQSKVASIQPLNEAALLVA